MISPINRMMQLGSKAFPRQGSAGFTFLELLFVIVVLSLIVSVAAPQLRKSFDSLALQGSVSDFVSLSRYAQAKAVTEAGQRRIRVELPVRRVVVETEETVKDFGGKETTMWKPERTKIIPASVTVEYGEGEGIVVFYADGTSTKADFKFSGRSNIIYAISFEPSTGYADVSEVE